MASSTFRSRRAACVDGTRARGVRRPVDDRTAPLYSTRERQIRPAGRSARLVRGIRMMAAVRMSAAGALVLVPLLAAAQIADYSVVTDERLVNPEPGNWLLYRRTYDGWGYSPLDQIDTENVKNLRPVWTVSTGITEGHEGVLIVNDGVMFVTTPLNRVLALDAATGDVLW